VQGNMNNAKKVRIKDAYKGDAGRGRIRIDPLIIKEMRLKSGDVIEISYPIGDKKTVALLFPGKDEDRGSNAIRIDSSLRRNLSASINAVVEIREITAALADRVTFAGVEESVILRKSEQLVRMLENRVITKGDFLSFNAMGRRIDFIVIDFFPKAAAVRIHLDTKITISEKTHKEILELEFNRISYDDIGGLDNEIQRVRDIVELPLKHPELFERMGIDPPKGILLYGPSGTGKTLLARAVAYETEAHFILINEPEIVSKFHGQSEENLRKVFEEAKDMSPSIVYIDQLDSIAPKRDEFSSETERRVIGQLISLLDGLSPRGNIIVIGETNRIDHIDDSLRRPGRFDREIEIKAPDMDSRHEILLSITRGVPLNEDVNLKEIAERTEGYVGADLKALIKEAALLPMKEILPQIKEDMPIPAEVLDELQIRMEHFITALGSIRPSTLRQMLTKP